MVNRTESGGWLLAAAIVTAAALMVTGPGGCRQQPASGAEEAAGEEPVEKLLHLVAEFGEGELLGEVKYKVERVGGLVVREFEAEIENGPPGEVFEVTLEGRPLGVMTIGPDGEGELEYSDESDKPPLPAGFVEPEAGASFTVGRFEGTFRHRE